MQVAGSYENEVAAVGVLVAAIKEIARAASPHNRVELELQRASGAFALSFFDGNTSARAIAHLPMAAYIYEPAPNCLALAASHSLCEPYLKVN